MTRGTNPTKRS